MVEPLRSAEKNVDAEIQRHRSEWNRIVATLGGDPGGEDWLRFRPLRTDREEDWSDWLAYLLETSRTGVLAHALFGPEDAQAVELAEPRVEREVRIADRRADLVVHFRPSGSSPRRHVSVEVKVGDRSFAKTEDTAHKLQGDEPDWRHFILIPPRHVELWRETAADDITPFTWEDVAVALRDGLRSDREALRWQVWAHAFCGAVEQRQLALHRPGSRFAALRILRRAARNV